MTTAQRKKTTDSAKRRSAGLLTNRICSVALLLFFLVGCEAASKRAVKELSVAEQGDFSVIQQAMGNIVSGEQPEYQPVHTGNLPADAASLIEGRWSLEKCAWEYNIEGYLYAEYNEIGGYIAFNGNTVSISVNSPLLDGQGMDVLNFEYNGLPYVLEDVSAHVSSDNKDWSAGFESDDGLFYGAATYVPASISREGFAYLDCYVFRIFEEDGYTYFTKLIFIRE